MSGLSASTTSCGGEGSLVGFDLSSMSEDASLSATEFVVSSMKGGMGSSSGTEERDDKGEEPTEDDILGPCVFECLPQREGVRRREVAEGMAMSQRDFCLRTKLSDQE
jgi:hypothetical protein